MKANDKRQIESIINKNFFKMIKLFFVCFLMNNPLIYIGLFPTAKNTYHFSVFSWYPKRQNLNAIGFQFFKLLYVDFSYSDFSDSLVVFISLNCFTYYKKLHFFIGLKAFRFLLLGNWKSLSLLKNNSGFISWELIDKAGNLFFKIIICLLLAAIFSFKDIDLEHISIQGFLNDMQYINNIIDKVFIR